MVQDRLNGGIVVPRTVHLRQVVLVLALAAGLGCAGCQSARVADKTGGQVTVIRLASTDVLNTNGQSVAPGVFIHEIQSLSGGQMKATVTLKFEDGNPTAETDLVKAIGAGQFDGGWPATRSFANAGIRGLEPLEAPMLLTSYAAERDVVTGPAGTALLQTLDHSPVIGLGLAVGPLRRPWAKDAPLLSPDDWRGTTFRVYNSPTQGAVVHALGGVPVNASYDFPDLISQGKLRGVETDIAQYAINGYGTLTPYATRNVVLWPRMTILTFSRARFDRLTAQEQGWMRQAAAKAVQASVDYSYDENTPAGALCGLGVRFLDASTTQLAALRQAVAPVTARLAADPTTSATFAQVQTAAARHPNPALPEVPPSCRQR